MISVIIPLYNKARYIARALDSVLAQTYTDFELIVVDDGSTDGSGDIVRQYADSRMRLITQANAGPGVARNRGLREAKGELVAFLDADDEWLPIFLEENKRFFDRYSSEASIVCADSLDAETGEILMPAQQRVGLREGICRLTPDMSREAALSLLMYLQWWKTLSRTECLRKWGGFFDRERGAYSGGEDMWLSFKVLLNEPIAISLKPLHLYHKEASELAPHVNRPSPLCPFVLYPEEIEAVCPEPLRDHLRYMLAQFACSAANTLGSNRQREEGRRLLTKFRCSSFVPFSYYLGAWLRTSRALSAPVDVVRTVRRWSRRGDR